MRAAASADEQVATMLSGAAGVVSEGELRARVERSRATGIPLTVKVGFDPTAPDLHLGHTVVLHKMRQFQDLGHTVFFVIGDFTGLIGDPTGKSETRRPLGREEIEANAQTYRQQVFRILDPERTRVVFNSSWLMPMRAEDVVRMSAQVTVARLLSREDFATRYESQRPIHLHELLYPLFQAQDSVALRADVEMGGTDQTFNLLVGRDLQRAAGQEPQVALTMPILVGTDGVQKMSKSLGNYVGITEPPTAMFGKLMSIADDVMRNYYALVSGLPAATVAEIEAALGEGRLHPMAAKKRLARSVVGRFHGEPAAEAAETAFSRQFQAREVPEALPRVVVTLGEAPGGLRLDQLALLSGLAASASEARRLIQQGGLRVDGERVRDPYQVVAAWPGQELVLQRGRREFRLVEVRAPGKGSEKGS